MALTEDAATVLEQFMHDGRRAPNRFDALHQTNHFF
jgi:hypothetical protein